MAGGKIKMKKYVHQIIFQMKTKIYIILLILAGLCHVKSFAQADYVIKDTAYITYPNSVALNSYYANVEDAEGACGNEGKHFRIRGLQDGGRAEFTVPNAENVTIVVKGKSASKDRIVRIYRDNELIQEISELDANNCATFSENIHRNSPVTYKVTGGNENDTKPVVIKSIIVEKYVDGSVSGIYEKQQVQLNVFPNPAKDVLNVEMSDNMLASSVTIFSATGSVVFEQKISEQSSFSLSINHLQKGIYILNVVSGEEVLVKKFVK